LTSTMKLPTFFLVGAMKAGTTSLYQYLNAHPKIFMSPTKEPNYFCKDFTAQSADRRGRITLWSDYVRLFEAARDETAIGEASVVYLGRGALRKKFIRHFQILGF
jgi:hypothetical protein